MFFFAINVNIKISWCILFHKYIHQLAQRIAEGNGIEIEFIRKLRAFRKDDRIQELISKTGKAEGLIHIFSAMEQCHTYKPWHDKTTGKTFLKFDQSKFLYEWTQPSRS